MKSMRNLRGEAFEAGEHVKVKGVPSAQATATPGVTDLGMPQVVVLISAFDVFQIPTVVTNLVMGVRETRDLAERMLAACVTAERLAAESPINKDGSVR